MKRCAANKCWIQIEVRFILTFAFILGLLYLTGCGWLFPKPEPSLSEEEAKAILSTLDEGTKLYRELTSEGNPNAAALVVGWLQNDPEVAEAFVEEDNSVYIIYKCGLVGVILSYEHSAKLAEGLHTLWTVNALSTWEKCFSQYSGIPSNVTILNSPQSRKAGIFVFKTEFYQNMAGETVKNSLESMGYNVEVWYGGEFTLERLEQLDQYGVIVFLTHGAASGVRSQKVWLFTGERANPSKLKSYFGKGRGVEIGSAVGEEGQFFIFDQHFIINKKLRFPNSLVLAMACHSFKWESMADAFLDRGAAAYFGWTDTSNEVFVYNFLNEFFVYGPRGWSVSKIMSYPIEWPLPGNPKASLQEVFGNPELPPKTVSCTFCFPPCQSKIVEVSLPALGYRDSKIPSICFMRREATPVLKWKSNTDLVLKPSDGPGRKGSIDISFAPTMVPFAINPTGGPGWSYTVTISEKNGVGVKLERLLLEEYDLEGKLLGQRDWDQKVFLRLFKTDKLDPKTSVSAKITSWPRPEGTPQAVLIWRVVGTDLNGNHLEASNTVKLQQNAKRGLKVEISPPIFVENRWQYEVSISEIRGMETKLMGISVITFDELEWSTGSYVVTDDDIAKIFGTNTIPGNGQIRVFVAQQPYDPADRALAWVVAGVDENGTMVYGSGVAELTVKTSEKVRYQEVQIILLLAPVVDGIEYGTIGYAF